MPMNQDIEHEVCRAIANHANIREEFLDGKHTLDGLALDSLELVDLVCDLESDLNIMIHDDEITLTHSVDEIVALCKKKKGLS